MRSKEELVKLIGNISSGANHGDVNLNLIAPVYAELICLLSDEAEEQSAKNVALSKDTRDLTVGLHRFTKWIICLTIVQVIFTVFFGVYSLIYSHQQATLIPIAAAETKQNPNLSYDQQKTTDGK